MKLKLKLEPEQKPGQSDGSGSSQISRLRLRNSAHKMRVAQDISINRVGNQVQQDTLLDKLTDDAIAQLYVTKFSTISLYLTKLYATKRFAIASSVTCSEIRNSDNSIGFRRTVFVRVNKIN